MSAPEPPTLAEQASALFHLTLTPEQEAQFEAYARELVSWNAHTNLTAIADPEGVRVRHFLDSLSVAKVLPLEAGMRVIDVGTGAGFPGLPLAILVAGLRVTLLEATGKKIAFLDHVIKTLGLTDARTLHARAEDAGHMDNHRAHYDLVLARAVARLPGLLEYMLPLAKVGGRCVALKGTTAREEADDAARALATLGGALERIEAVTLPGVDEPHHLVIVQKVGKTPPSYPRKPGIPTRKPL
jgi:16S rRNA (guanine527-N7)-methyltransferase